MDRNIKERIIYHDATIISALKQMDKCCCKLLLVVDSQNTFKGVLSIGDIQRAIISNIPIENKISEILRSKPRIGNEDFTIETIKAQMFKYRMEFMPIIDNNGNISNVYFWEDLFLDSTIPPAKQFSLPVVIMAGGFGTRLKPLTNVLPKPLIPIGDKTIVEGIFERFSKYGCKDFYISVNYKAELIEFYLNNLGLPYKLIFFREIIPLGTAGSLSLLKGKISQTFFVSNCDILIEDDYSEILDYHIANKNEITLIAALKSYSIPYGTLETGEKGQLLELREKPELTFKINSGMYILEPHLLNEIPENQFFHITHLIEQIKNRGGKIGVFPISQKSWADIGDWSEYKKNANIN